MACRCHPAERGPVDHPRAERDRRRLPPAGRRAGAGDEPAGPLGWHGAGALAGAVDPEPRAIHGASSTRAPAQSRTGRRPPHGPLGMASRSGAAKVDAPAQAMNLPGLSDGTGPALLQAPWIPSRGRPMAHRRRARRRSPEPAGAWPMAGATPERCSRNVREGGLAVPAACGAPAGLEAAVSRGVERRGSAVAFAGCATPRRWCPAAGTASPRSAGPSSDPTGSPPAQSGTGGRAGAPPVRLRWPRPGDPMDAGASGVRVDKALPPFAPLTVRGTDRRLRRTGADGLGSAAGSRPRVRTGR
jgi:hypothetical protein